jgi:LCP family protein required for cell wall assembly
MSSDLSNFQRIELDPNIPQRQYALRPRRSLPNPRGCLVVGLIIFGLLCLLTLLPALIPGRTNVLLLGVDARPGEGDLGRTDTMILTTFQPLRPYVGMLTIPRDLWVNIPNVGENRINTAHFFAEAEKPGSGPAAAMEAVHQNFGVDVHYFVRIRFDGLKGLVDAIGGLDVTLPRAMSGYEAGTHHMDGTQALAFVRDRAGSDDLFRNERAIIFLKAFLRQGMRPAAWLRLPAFLAALRQTVDTDIPWWAWSRLGMALLRVGPDGIEGRSFTHEMVQPFTTAGGASVLLPRWELINPVLLELFGQ